MRINILDFTNSHKLCVVTTRKQYSYACTWAVEKDREGNVLSPTIDQVREAWNTDKSDFERYNGMHFV